MDHLSPGTMVAIRFFFPGIISNKCWMIKRSVCLVKQISLLEVVSTCSAASYVVVDLLEFCMLLTQLHFKLLTGAHLLLMEH